MFQAISDGLLWLLSSTGPTLVVLGLIGYMFREKWKQVLSKSLSVEIEELKHGFQKDLEAYKVTLIAQAEEVKIRGDVRKTIASKFEGIRFDRLVELESALSKTGTFFIQAVAYTEAVRTAKQHGESVELQQKLQESRSAAEMFLSLDEKKQLLEFNGLLVDFFDNIGLGKPRVPHEDPKWKGLVIAHAKACEMIRGKIQAQAAI